MLALLRADRTLGLIFGLQLAYTLALNSLYEFSPLWMLQNAGFGSRGIAFVTAGQCAVMTLDQRAGRPLRRRPGRASAAPRGAAARWSPRSA